MWPKNLSCKIFDKILCGNKKSTFYNFSLRIASRFQFYVNSGAEFHASLNFPGLRMGSTPWGLRLLSPPPPPLPPETTIQWRPTTTTQANPEHICSTVVAIGPGFRQSRGSLKGSWPRRRRRGSRNGNLNVIEWWQVAILIGNTVVAALAATLLAIEIAILLDHQTIMIKENLKRRSGMKMKMNI